MGYDVPFEVVFDDLLDAIYDSKRPDINEAEMAMGMAILGTFHIYVSEAVQTILCDMTVVGFEHEYNRLLSYISKARSHFSDGGVLDSSMQSGFSEARFVTACVNMYARDLGIFGQTFDAGGEVQMFRTFCSAFRHIEKISGRNLLLELPQPHRELFSGIIAAPKPYLKDELLDDKWAEALAAQLTEGGSTTWNNDQLVWAMKFVHGVLTASLPKLQRCILFHSIDRFNSFFTQKYSSGDFFAMLDSARILKEFSDCVQQYTQGGFDFPEIMERLHALFSPFVQCVHTRLIDAFEQSSANRAGAKVPLFALSGSSGQSCDIGSFVAQAPILEGVDKRGFIDEDDGDRSAELTGLTRYFREMDLQEPEQQLFRVLGYMPCKQQVDPCVIVGELLPLLASFSSRADNARLTVILKKVTHKAVAAFISLSEDMIFAWRDTPIPKPWCEAISKTLILRGRQNTLSTLCDAFPQSRSELEIAWLVQLASVSQEEAAALLFNKIDLAIKSRPIQGINDLVEVIAEHATLLKNGQDVLSLVVTQLMRTVVPRAIDRLVSEIARDPIHSDVALLELCAVIKGVRILINGPKDVDHVEMLLSEYRAQFLPHIIERVLQPLSGILEEKLSASSIYAFHTYHSLLLNLFPSFEQAPPHPLLRFDVVYEYVTRLLSPSIIRCEEAMAKSDVLATVAAVDALYYAYREVKTQFHSPEFDRIDTIQNIGKLASMVVSFFSAQIQRTELGIKKNEFPAMGAVRSIQALFRLRALISLVFPYLESEVKSSFSANEFGVTILDSLVSPVVDLFLASAEHDPIPAGQMFDQLLCLSQAKELLYGLKEWGAKIDIDWYRSKVVPVVLSKLFPVSMEAALREFETDPLPRSCYDTLLNCFQVVETLIIGPTRQLLFQKMEDYNPRLNSIIEKLIQPRSFIIDRTDIASLQGVDSWVPSKEVIDTFYRALSKVRLGEKFVDNTVVSSVSAMQTCRDFGRIVFMYFSTVAPDVPKVELENAVIQLIERLPIEVSSCRLFDLFAPLGLNHSFVHPRLKQTQPAFRYDKERRLLIGQMKSDVWVAPHDDIETIQARVQLSVDVCIDPVIIARGQWQEVVTISSVQAEGLIDH